MAKPAKPKTAKPLTKHQKKMLKKKIAKQRLLEKKKAQKRKEDIKRILKYAGLFVIVIAVVSLVYTLRPGSETSPVLKITPESINLKEVSVSKGTITTSIKIENAGKEDLVLNDMETSCACTSAALVYDGVEGPLFNMRAHGTNPKDWNATIKPGETASLKIYYDPTVHDDLRGPVTRYIMIYSNDPKSPVKTVYVNLKQVD